MSTTWTIFQDISQTWSHKSHHKELYPIKVINEIDDSIPEFFQYNKNIKIIDTSRYSKYTKSKSDYAESNKSNNKTCDNADGNVLIKQNVIKELLDTTYQNKRKFLSPCECKFSLSESPECQKICVKSSIPDKNCNCNPYYKLVENNGRFMMVLRAIYLQENNTNLPRDIWECSDICGCDPDACLNRTVGSFENNMAVRTVVKKTRKRGFGLFADEKIFKGQYVGPYQGEMKLLSSTVLKADSFDSNRPNFDDTYIFLCHKDLQTTQGDKVIIDSKKQGNITRFINHSCDENLIVYHVLRLSEKCPVIGLFAMRDIEVGEEIFLNYTGLYWASMNRKGVFCCCGSEKCGYSEERFVAIC